MRDLRDKATTTCRDSLGVLTGQQVCVRTEGEGLVSDAVSGKRTWLVIAYPGGRGGGAPGLGAGQAGHRIVSAPRCRGPVSRAFRVTEIQMWARRR